MEKNYKEDTIEKNTIRFKYNEEGNYLNSSLNGVLNEILLENYNSNNASSSVDNNLNNNDDTVSNHSNFSIYSNIDDNSEVDRSTITNKNIIQNNFNSNDKLYNIVESHMLNEYKLSINFNINNNYEDSDTIMKFYLLLFSDFNKDIESLKYCNNISMNDIYSSIFLKYFINKVHKEVSLVSSLNHNSILLDFIEYLIENSSFNRSCSEPAIINEIKIEKCWKDTSDTGSEIISIIPIIKFLINYADLIKCVNTSLINNNNDNEVEDFENIHIYTNIVISYIFLFNSILINEIKSILENIRIIFQVKNNKNDYDNDDSGFASEIIKTIYSEIIKESMLTFYSILICDNNTSNNNRNKNNVILRNKYIDLVNNGVIQKDIQEYYNKISNNRLLSIFTEVTSNFKFLVDVLNHKRYKNDSNNKWKSSPLNNYNNSNIYMILKYLYNVILSNNYNISSYNKAENENNGSHNIKHSLLCKTNIQHYFNNKMNTATLTNLLKVILLNYNNCHDEYDKVRIIYNILLQLYKTNYNSILTSILSKINTNNINTTNTSDFSITSNMNNYHHYEHLYVSELLSENIIVTTVFDYLFEDLFISKLDKGLNKEISKTSIDKLFNISINNTRKKDNHFKQICYKSIINNKSYLFDNKNLIKVIDRIKLAHSVISKNNKKITIISHFIIELISIFYNNPINENNNSSIIKQFIRLLIIRRDSNDINENSMIEINENNNIRNSNTVSKDIYQLLVLMILISDLKLLISDNYELEQNTDSLINSISPKDHNALEIYIFETIIIEILLVINNTSNSSNNSTDHSLYSKVLCNFVLDIHYFLSSNIRLSDSLVCFGDKIKDLKSSSFNQSKISIHKTLKESSNKFKSCISISSSKKDKKIKSFNDLNNCSCFSCLIYFKNKQKANYKLFSTKIYKKTDNSIYDKDNKDTDIEYHDDKTDRRALIITNFSNVDKSGIKNNNIKLETIEKEAKNVKRNKEDKNLHVKDNSKSTNIEFEDDDNKIIHKLVSYSSYFNDTFLPSIRDRLVKNYQASIYNRKIREITVKAKLETSLKNDNTNIIILLDSDITVLNQYLEEKNRIENSYKNYLTSLDYNNINVNTNTKIDDDDILSDSYLYNLLQHHLQINFYLRLIYMINSNLLIPIIKCNWNNNKNFNNSKKSGSKHMLSTVKRKSKISQKSKIQSQSQLNNNYNKKRIIFTSKLQVISMTLLRHLINKVELNNEKNTRNKISLFPNITLNYSFIHKLLCYSNSSLKEESIQFLLELNNKNLMDIEEVILILLNEMQESNINVNTNNNGFKVKKKIINTIIDIISSNDDDWNNNIILISVLLRKSVNIEETDKLRMIILEFFGKVINENMYQRDMNDSLYNRDIISVLIEMINVKHFISVCLEEFNMYNNTNSTNNESTTNSNNVEVLFKLLFNFQLLSEDGIVKLIENILERITALIKTKTSKNIDCMKNNKTQHTCTNSKKDKTINFNSISSELSKSKTSKKSNIIFDEEDNSYNNKSNTPNIEFLIIKYLILIKIISEYSYNISKYIQTILELIPENNTIYSIDSYNIFSSKERKSEMNFYYYRSLNLILSIILNSFKFNSNLNNNTTIKEKIRDKLIHLLIENSQKKLVIKNTLNCLYNVVYKNSFNNEENSKNINNIIDKRVIFKLNKDYYLEAFLQRNIRMVINELDSLELLLHSFNKGLDDTLKPNYEDNKNIDILFIFNEYLTKETILNICFFVLSFSYYNLNSREYLKELIKAEFYEYFLKTSKKKIDYIEKYNKVLSLFVENGIKKKTEDNFLFSSDGFLVYLLSRYLRIFCELIEISYKFYNDNNNDDSNSFNNSKNTKNSKINIKIVPLNEKTLYKEFNNKNNKRNSIIKLYKTNNKTKKSTIIKDNSDKSVPFAISYSSNTAISNITKTNNDIIFDVKSRSFPKSYFISSYGKSALLNKIKSIVFNVFECLCLMISNNFSILRTNPDILIILKSISIMVSDNYETNYFNFDDENKVNFLKSISDDNQFQLLNSLQIVYDSYIRIISNSNNHNSIKNCNSNITVDYTTLPLYFEYFNKTILNYIYLKENKDLATITHSNTNSQTLRYKTLQLLETIMLTSTIEKQNLYNFVFPLLNDTNSNIRDKASSILLRIIKSNNNSNNILIQDLDKNLKDSYIYKQRLLEKSYLVNNSLVVSLDHNNNEVIYKQHYFTIILNKITTLLREKITKNNNRNKIFNSSIINKNLFCEMFKRLLEIVRYNLKTVDNLETNSDIIIGSRKEFYLCLDSIENVISFISDFSCNKDAYIITKGDFDKNEYSNTNEFTMGILKENFRYVVQEYDNIISLEKIKMNYKIEEIVSILNDVIDDNKNEKKIKNLTKKKLKNNNNYSIESSRAEDNATVDTNLDDNLDKNIYDQLINLSLTLIKSLLKTLLISLSLSFIKNKWNIRNIEDEENDSSSESSDNIDNNEDYSSKNKKKIKYKSFANILNLKMSINNKLKLTYYELSSLYFHLKEIIINQYIKLTSLIQKRNLELVNIIIILLLQFLKINYLIDNIDETDKEVIKSRKKRENYNINNNDYIDDNITKIIELIVQYNKSNKSSFINRELEVMIHYYNYKAIKKSKFKNNISNDIYKENTRYFGFEIINNNKSLMKIISKGIKSNEEFSYLGKEINNILFKLNK